MEQVSSNSVHAQVWERVSLNGHWDESSLTSPPVLFLAASTVGLCLSLEVTFDFVAGRLAVLLALFCRVAAVSFLIYESPTPQRVPGGSRGGGRCSMAGSIGVLRKSRTMYVTVSSWAHTPSKHTRGRSVTKQSVKQHHEGPCSCLKQQLTARTIVVHDSSL